MAHGHPSRLVTLGENLALLTETGTLAAITLAGFAGSLIRAPFQGPPSASCGCSCGRRDSCCYDPPIYRCGGC